MTYQHPLGWKCGHVDCDSDVGHSPPHPCSNPEVYRMVRVESQQGRLTCMELFVLWMWQTGNKRNVGKS